MSEVMARRRVFMIYNPIAGAADRKRLKRALARLEVLDCDVTLKATGERGDAEALARDVDVDAYDVIAVAGGDGTINEVANGLAGKSIPLGVVSSGTANVLAWELGLPPTPEGQADAIARGTAQPIHLGFANGRYFLMMASVGFDAHVVARVTPGLKRALGKMAYVWKTLVRFTRHSFKTYQLEIDGKRFEAATAVIANGHYYGGRFVCARDARLQDPELHVCLFKSPGTLSYLRYALWLLMGRLHRLPDFEVVPGRSITIDGPEGEHGTEPVQADGDLFAALPLKAELGRERLNLLVPA